MAKRITKNMFLFSLCIVSLIMIILAINYWNQGSAAKPSNRTPIMIVNSKDNNHKPMKTVLNRDGAPEAIKVTIKKNNNFSIDHNHRINGSHPVILLDFQKNYSGNKSEMIVNIINYLHNKYHYQKFDSIGFDDNSINLFTAFTSHQIDSKVKLNRFISIASDFKQINFNESKNKFNKNVKVLNVYGKINKKVNSDGVVFNKNSQRLKYAVNNHDNYQEAKLKGKSASHQSIVKNPVLFRIVSRFIFDD
ncbi:alpha/beta hydrolase [Lactobacillus sp. S2-2]|uniref:alpha/beta hydrolase n=1 Tax=Lactobacillus sp. S2-2 TaxID=2692917 RepID=UPI001F3F6AA4|nr:alpha/beta hydrolase [Lactobacillus sp. S2-2]MCF6514689.1 alpha/beta hydrolase [Lactobacillus sp. S2-2]